MYLGVNHFGAIWKRFKLVLYNGVKYVVKNLSLEHTLFLDFLKLFVNMRFAASFAGRKKTHFLDLRIKSYGCLKFQGEVWAGRACAAANEKELTT
jgi:hypothetical protein